MGPARMFLPLAAQLGKPYLEVIIDTDTGSSRTAGIMLLLNCVRLKVALL
jgi:hypothetical protein